MKEITRDEYSKTLDTPPFPLTVLAGCTFLEGDSRHPEGFVLTEWGKSSAEEPLLKYERRGKEEKFYRAVFNTKATRAALDVARRHLRSDTHLANFALRDLPELKVLGLTGTAWAAHRGTPSRRDVEYLIAQIETLYPVCGCRSEGSCHCHDYAKAERCDETCLFCETEARDEVYAT